MPGSHDSIQNQAMLKLLGKAGALSRQARMGSGAGRIKGRGRILVEHKFII
jgi:hypothetical protein